jgi:hypothetical protein
VLVTFDANDQGGHVHFEVRGPGEGVRGCGDVHVETVWGEDSQHSSSGGSCSRVMCAQCRQCCMVMLTPTRWQCYSD